MERATQTGQTLIRRLLAIGVCLVASGGLRAHEFAITDVVVLIKSDATYQVDVRVDADALALGVSPASDNAELVAELEALSAAQFETSVERAADTLSRRIRLRFDGEKQRPLVSFPEMGTALADDAEIPTVLGTTARLTARIPDGARELTFGASRSFGVVQLTILEQETLGGVRHLLDASEDSPVYLLGRTAEAPPREVVALRYAIVGFEHIVPLGLDHVLFVLGLFLLGTRLSTLLWQVTAFTVAHSVTLALSMAGVIALSPRIVEPLIALSIAYVALENVATTELKPWRPLLVFGFGLLHGLGFADALRELGLPRGEFIVGVVSFNVGVELGQLAVIGLALLTLGRFRSRPWYRSRVTVPISLAIAAIALYWTIERVF